ncbi:MAG: hypothetical protein AAGF11_00245 [Myxococcota bacterium]
MTRRLPPAALAFALGLLPGCDSEEAKQTAKEASDKALEASKDKAAELAQSAKTLGKKAANATKDAANKVADTTKDAAGKAVDASTKAVHEAVEDATEATRAGAQALVDDLRPDGELSQTAQAWLENKAKQTTETDIETIIVAGVQLAPIALEASRVLADSVDSNTVIEPIFQKIDDDPAKIDAAIGNMPRVEALDGVTVGFEQMDQLDARTSVKQRGYLVMWRHEQHLVGFVYRSTRTIDIDALVAETPRLVKLTQQALTK